MSDYPKISIHNKLNMEKFWPALGKHYTDFGQMVCELADNALSNFRGANLPAQHRKVLISLQETPDGVFVRFQDSGTGIVNLGDALSLAGCADLQTVLNEHGLGLKNVLSAGDPKNECFCLSTRTAETAKRGVYLRVSAPFSVEDDFSAEEIPGWVGSLGETGTVIEFTCRRDILDRMVPGEDEKKSMKAYCEVLREILGVTYCNALESKELEITIHMMDPSDKTAVKAFPVFPVAPEMDPDPALKYGMTWEEMPDWKETVVSLSPAKKAGVPGEGRGEDPCGKVRIRYRMGFIRPSVNNWKYYLGDMDTSGVEVAIDGRLIVSNLFTEVFHTKRHNVYNRYLARVELYPYYEEGEDPAVRKDCLPPTNPTKTGFLQGDPRTTALYDWINKNIAIPKLDTAELETMLLDQLKLQERDKYPYPADIQREYPVFDDLGGDARADMVVFRDDEIYLFEGKARTSRMLDAFQVALYWFGLTHEKKRPSVAYLVATDHPAKVVRLVRHLNNVLVCVGEYFNLELKTWGELGIANPLESAS